MDHFPRNCSTSRDGPELHRHDLPGYRALLRGETVTREELHYTFGNCSTVIASCSAAPIYGSNGSIIAAVIIAEDVTEARRLEAEKLALSEEERVTKATLKAQAGRTRSAAC